MFPRLRLTSIARHFSTSLSSRMAASFPKTIKAIVAPRTGGVDVIELAELPFPTQQPNEAVVKVIFSTN